MSAWTEPVVQLQRGRTVHAAVVGVGYWGPNLVRNMHELPDAAVDAVCDIDPQALAKLRERWPALRCVTDFDALLADDAIEAIAIATPVGTHAALAEAALRAGKHVFVEKPLAASSSAGERLIEIATERDLVLMPGHTFLYSPAVTYIRSLIADGSLGDIQFISMSRLNLGLHQPDVSVVWDLGPHDIAILRYWLDELPDTVSAMSRGCVIADTPDIAFVNMRFPSGTIANLEIGWLAPTKLRRTVVVGSRKMVVYDDTSPEPVRVYDSGVIVPQPSGFGEYQLSYRSGEMTSPALLPVEPLYLELADFFASIRDGREPRSTAAFGLDVVRVTEAVDQSLEDGGSPVGMARTRDRVAADAQTGE
ncbi:MAG: Gfo/Idh/MocA family oxidoreductase [Actinomycetota bacterium]